MADTRRKVDEVSIGQKIIFAAHEYADLRVVAHLPDGFTSGISGEYTEPLSAFAAQGKLTTLAALGGVTTKQGLITQRVYTGPEQPEYNFELKFDAYYDAFNEVMVPVLRLLAMGSPIRKKLLKSLKAFMEDKNAIATDMLNKIDKQAQSVPIETRNGKGLQFHFLKSPPLCRVIVGNIYVLDRVFLSAVNVTFSNVLDHDFYPMSATVQVTCLPEQPMDLNDIGQMFHAGNLIRKGGQGSHTGDEE